MSRCFMADYCKYSLDGVNCNADGKIVSECLYLKAIAEIARLNVEQTNYEVGKSEKQ